MCEKALLGEAETLDYLLARYKTQDMFERAVEDNPYVIYWSVFLIIIR